MTQSSSHVPKNIENQINHRNVDPKQVEEQTCQNIG